MKRYSPLLLLTLLLTLFVVPTLSQAAPTTAPAKPTIVHLALRDADTEDDEEFDGEAEEIEIEECEAAEGSFEFDDEEEFEEVEEDEEFEIEECEEEVLKKKNGAAVTAPEECRVGSAESSITTLPSSNRVQLTLRY